MFTVAKDFRFAAAHQIPGHQGGCQNLHGHSYRVRVHVQDTGVGLPEEVRAHLFEPYFTTKTEGTGLGLAIALRVLEEMGGTIELRAARADEGGRGTVVEVSLPAWRGPADAEGAAAG